ncbi:putative membrane protein [Propionispora sp. 2/2-37]|uniref:hemolysin family protein n=1 Tax=Propionispora sp. 2/2-37 TaxID=1677858 RepID=UPI0006BB98B2|nr:hemolysin family protein [Propionispora sp. 2/2-37]CUH94166.1 putative membrane protein [Propionispora sp. 2/2-37]
MLNGFFVVAEFSLFRVKKTRLEELAQQGNNRARLALKVMSAFDTYLGATQLGTTLSSLALGWLGEPAVASLLKSSLNQNLPENLIWVSSLLSVLIGFFSITFLHIVLGELVPKTLAIQKAEGMALTSVRALFVFHKITYPVIWLFQQAARVILAAMQIKPVNETELTHSEEELRMIVSASQRGGVLDQMESELIDNVFDFADRLAREIMVPRQDMICLFMDDSYEENIRIVRETNHTRYPLCVEDKDHVIGMVHLRDLMDFDLRNSANKDLKTIMREILVVPEGMSVAKLLQVMKRKRIHLAVVADEYGGTAGLVALEDIIEEIVGDIQDEHDEVVEGEIQRLADGAYEFDGRVLLDDVADILHIQLGEHEEDTLGGYIFGLLGRRPEIGDQARIDEYQFEVLKVNGFRIVRVKAELLTGWNSMNKNDN